MPIRVLPQEMASQIAAGEVVERPASVAKELIENALDAGATQIDVEVRAGGVGLIRVVDNGCGIPAGEVETAFARYATSKLASPEDLERIATLGFRGEALPSIAAVAEVSVLTRPHAEVGGIYLRVAEGRILERVPRGAPPGTSITVKGLFRNIPARLKFLKSNAAEAARIATLVNQYALAFPEVRFSLSVEGRSSFGSQGDGDLRQVFARVYGLEAAEAMLPVEWEDAAGDMPMRVSGLASPPAVTRSNRSYLTIFVNRRLVQNRALSYAVLDAYQGLLMAGRFPIAVLNLFIDPAETDVNVHPSKMEIKFRDEGIAFGAIRKAVQQALAQGPYSRLAKTMGEPDAAAPPPVRSALREPIWLSGQAPEPFPVGPIPAPVSNGQAVQAHMRLPVLRMLGQLGRTYIVAEGPDGMYLIDQHAAHERVLFDLLRGQKSRGEVKAQLLLEPAMVELTPQQQASAEAHDAILVGYGFSFEAFGARAVMLRSIPEGLKSRTPAQALLDVLDDLDRSELKGYDWEERVLITVACHSAVRAGQDLAPREMEEMVRQLEVADSPRTCPHGRPTMIHVSSFQLEREFGRR